MEKMHSVQEVAKLLSVPRQRIYELINNGQLQANDLNAGLKGKRRWLKISEDAIQALLEKTKIN